MKKFLLLVAALIVLLAVGQGLNLIPQKVQDSLRLPQKKEGFLDEKQTVVYEESVVTQVVEKSLPSVVTVGVSAVIQEQDTIELNPLDPFAPIRRTPGESQLVERNIGSGFVIAGDGLIITNKHVVANEGVKYTVLTNDKKKYEVDQIYRDPLNDLAILKIKASGLKPLPLGTSKGLKLGQLAIAIGTPLGEFTNTVTVGIVSGLGRGITAGSPFEGFVEKLDNVIQTDAAINPGNSGGPLLASSGKVIGVNTAVASDGQNLGFAIPVDVAAELIADFERRGGSFDRPYIGVRYKLLDKQTALLNSVVEGAYVIEVLDNSPAAAAGLAVEDIITEFDNQKITGTDEQSLTRMILKKNIGDRVNIKYWRAGRVVSATLTLEAFK